MEKEIIIGIDSSRSNVVQRTGTEYYAYEIIKGLISLRAAKKYTFKLYSKTPLNYLNRAKNIENVVMPFPRLWSQVRLSFEMLKNPPAVLFEPAHTIPLFHPKNTVVTLHDVGFRRFPELYTPLERYYHNFCMGFSVKHARKIIAISESTKNDLIKIYKADPKKISVIYHGYDKSKYYQATKEAPEKIKKLQPYIYFIGRLEAKKNVKNLIRAFGVLKKDKRIKQKLVLAGRPGYQYEKIKEEIERLGAVLKDDVVELGYVSDADAPEYMRYASVFAFPSRFEGFGMPLVEAMACGVPIVSVNKTSIPEIVQEAALLSEPDDIRQISENLREAILSKKTREDLITRGLQRAGTFDWSKTADKTLSVIESTLFN